MENFKPLSNTGLIFWAITIIIYFVSFIINCFYYSKSSISSRQKAIYERFLKQNRILVIIVRSIVIIFSMLALILIQFYDLRKTVNIMLVLIGVILPTYFLSLIAVKLEEMSLARPVVEPKIEQ